MNHSLQRALKNAWLSEVQAISIYETECFLLRRSCITAARKETLEVCEKILLEELHHSESLISYIAPGFVDVVQAQFSRAGGLIIGCALTFLPSGLNWRFHAWAEREASKIYQLAAKSLNQLRGDSLEPALLATLQRAIEQELGHAQRFEALCGGEIR